jgi:hypothetical protein
LGFFGFCKDNKDLNLDDAYKQLYKDYFLEKYENE